MATKEELLEEIKRLEAKEEALKAPPTPLPDPDFSATIEVVESVIDEIVSDGYEDSDSSEYVYEAVLEAVYGKDIWEWRKKALAD